ncbi:hypothetical protein Scep_016637 [Stephania cephalantha]|uniref:Mediator complex subunit 15 KIX domain-containing protein n=1 Tax=Stephania cephalantha TaxID=152367 RepID=A0AAP0IMZ2_9MAGN
MRMVSTRSKRVEPPPPHLPIWRTHLDPASRSRIIDKIMQTLRRHLPIYGPEGLIELRKIAGRFEEKIFDSASSQDDYLRKISLKMLTMEAKSQSTSGRNFSQASSAT